MHTIIIDKKTEKLWDGMVSESELAGSFLEMKTLQHLAVNEVPKANLVCVGVADKEGGKLLAGWPLLVRCRLGIRYNSSFPLFYGGPFYAPPLDRGDDRKINSKRLDVLKTLIGGVKEVVDVCDCETVPNFPDVRACIYSGFAVHTEYCHMWDPCNDSAIRQLNRTKRNEANRALLTHTFDWMNLDEVGIGLFNRMHDMTLDKFGWSPSTEWRESLANHTITMGELGLCRLYAAWNEDGHPAAVVSVLLDKLRGTAYLWRVGTDNDTIGLVPALYSQAGDAIREEFGQDWSINFGGSPQLSLSRFKDYLGAQPTPHYRLQWQKPGRASLIWNGGFAIKLKLLRMKGKLSYMRGGLCARG